MERNDDMKHVDAEGTTDAESTTDAEVTVEGNHIDGFYLRDNRDEAKHEEAKHEEAKHEEAKHEETKHEEAIKQVKELYVNLVEAEQHDDDDDEEPHVVLPHIEAQLTEVEATNHEEKHTEAERTTEDVSTTHNGGCESINSYNNIKDDEIIVSDYFSHLNEVGMSYTEHLCFSLKLGACMLVGSVAAIIHAVYPDILITSTTDTIHYIQKELKKRNDMIELQKRINKELHKIKRH